MSKNKNNKKQQKKRKALLLQRKKNRRLLIVILSVFLILLVLPVGGFSILYSASRQTAERAYRDYSYSGERIQFGSYPQSLITDKATLTALEVLPLQWTYYNDCFSGDGYYGTAKQTACMKYADVEYNGCRYRAVTIERYRPESVLDPSFSETSLQDDNGFMTDTVYWFAYEPIKWIVFNEADGMLLSEAVLEAMPFNDNFYWIDRNFSGAPDYRNEFSANAYLFFPSNAYKTSSVRKWLNRDFYTMAFNKEERGHIKQTLHATNETTEKNRYGFASLTLDKVFLLSADEISKYYRLDSVPDQYASPTDYAKCRGAYASADRNGEYSWWWLRTPGDESGDAMSVFIDESVTNTDRQFFYTYIVGGIRCSLFLSTREIETLRTENN